MNNKFVFETNAHAEIISNFFDIVNIDHEVSETSIFIKANTIQSFANYDTKLSNTSASKLLNSFTITIKFLNKFNYTIPFLQCDKAYLINEDIFIPLNLIEITDNAILIENIYEKSDPYLSYELTKINELPTRIHAKSCYFSLAKFIIHFLFYYKKTIPKDSDYSSYLNTIYGSKLYWILNHCLNTDPNLRMLIIINIDN